MLILLQGFASGRTLMLVIQKLGHFQQTEQALTAVLKRSGQKAPLITLQGRGRGGVLQDGGQLHTDGLQGNTSGSSA
ncbi:hypothetical protein OYC64_005587 [Pagothenia borchgrevinki]|uniref:Uncharacterized protein n=1 Tax=Pagothenia borchgrevinki TaxID=8213 RepID=A0ABD2GGS5_PAGBO